MNGHSREIAHGERFSFGANWRRFLYTLNDSRIIEAEASLQQLLEVDDLSNKTFLDIGCGSGLFSLAARRLGAIVHSFDYDPQSVACTKELKGRYFVNDSSWVIEEGSILDKKYIHSLGRFDFVYSWGVLHHTGNMVEALENAAIPVKETGSLCIAIYNDQDIISRIWRKIKKTYCAGLFGKSLMTVCFVPLFILQSTATSLIKYRNPTGQFVNYKKKRGMSIYHDWIDWLGGYPFEVAKPERIFLFYRDIGFRMTNLITTNKLGCNQFVFQRLSQVAVLQDCGKDIASLNKISIKKNGESTPSSKKPATLRHL